MKSRGRGIIVGRKAPAQSLCPTCVRMRVYHKVGLYVCPTPVDVLQALSRFKAANGVRWKAKLCDHWRRACADISDFAERSLLQQAMNIIGPGRLPKLVLADVKIPGAQHSGKGESEKKSD